MIDKKAATNLTLTMDKIAKTFQKGFQELNIPEKVAMDFAYRCDLLSDMIERTAGIKKKALDEFDPVKEVGLDPEVIGEEVSGTLEGDGDEPYMRSEFSQQENRELRERQEDADLGARVNLLPQTPQTGKQAFEDSLQNLSDMDEEMMEEEEMEEDPEIETSLLGDLSTMLDNLRIIQVALGKYNFDSVKDALKNVSDSIGRHVVALNKVKDLLIDIEGSGGDLDPLAGEYLDKIMRAVEEVLPHLDSLMDVLESSEEDSPTDQLKLQDMLKTKFDYLSKLSGLSLKIITKASKNFLSQAVEEIPKVVVES